MRPSGFGACAAVTAALALAVGVVDAAGQEPTPEAERPCVAVLSPAAVPVGAEAVQVMASLSRDVGEVTSVESTRGDGIAVASPEDMRRTALVAGQVDPEPIQMGAGENTWTLWLNTVDARPGDHRLRIVAQDGVCEGSLSVTPVVSG